MLQVLRGIPLAAQVLSAAGAHDEIWHSLLLFGTVYFADGSAAQMAMFAQLCELFRIKILPRAFAVTNTAIHRVALTRALQAGAPRASLQNDFSVPVVKMSVIGLARGVFLVCLRNPTLPALPLPRQDSHSICPFALLQVLQHLLQFLLFEMPTQVLHEHTRTRHGALLEEAWRERLNE